MFVAMDEPEQVIRLLFTLAGERLNAGGRREWRIVAEYMSDCGTALEKANETPRR